jgi:hypothetical protein
MTRIHQVFGHGAADVSGHAGNENLQCLVLVFIVIPDLNRSKGQVFQVQERFTIRLAPHMS